MDANRWKQVRETFHAAVMLPSEERREYLNYACNGDSELHDMVARLIAHDETVAHSGEQAFYSIVAAGERNQDLPAEDLGAYQFTKFLGRGGMGSVYEARHRFTKQQVAIKVLRAGEMSSASRERFATEQRALARLNHPLIAQLYASESFPDGTPCFIMEYVEGERLTSHCSEKHSSVRDRILLFRQVCQAVGHAHEHGVIHRDLKPSNIMVKPDGSIRLLDFGIAKQLDNSEMDITGSQRAPMTIRYAAPEQISGEPVGTHTDVYALGVTLYELITGRTPHDLTGLTPGAAETVILAGMVKPPSCVVGEKSDSRISRTDWKDLDVLCATAMHKDSARRYGSVEALMRDLDHWLARERLDAQPDSFWYRTSKFVERNRKGLAITATLVLVAITAASWFTWNLAQARNRAVREELRTARVEHFLLSLFDNGDSEAGPSRTANALTLLERGRKEADTLSSEPDLQADLYQVLGGLYEKLGQFDQANTLLQASLKDRFSASGLIAIGSLRAEQLKFPEAEKLVRQGLSLLQTNPNSGKLEVAAAQADLGEVLLRAEKPRDATPILEDALRVQTEQKANDADLGKTLNLLGNANHELGNYPKGLALYQRALVLDRRTYGGFHPRVGNDLEGVGSEQLMQLNYPEAEASYRRALNIFENWYGMENLKTAEVLTVLGEALAKEGRPVAARQMLMKGSEISRRFGLNNQTAALTLMELATLDQKAGDLDAARTHFEETIRLLTQLYGDQNQPVAVATANLGTLEMKAKHYQKAEALYGTALRYFTAHVPPDSPELAKLRWNVGQVLYYQHRYAESQQALQPAIIVLSATANFPPADLAKAKAMLAKDEQHVK